MVNTQGDCFLLEDGFVSKPQSCQIDLRVVAAASSESSVSSIFRVSIALSLHIWVSTTESPPCTWACANFTLLGRTVEIRASKLVCQILNNPLPTVVQSLKQRLPHVFKFLGASGKIVVPEDVRLIDLNSDRTDVAFSMGWSRPIYLRKF